MIAPLKQYHLDMYVFKHFNVCNSCVLGKDKRTGCWFLLVQCKKRNEMFHRILVSCAQIGHNLDANWVEVLFINSTGVFPSYIGTF